MRLYLVTPTKKLPHETKPRLIRASTPAQAVRFATSEFYTVMVATADQAVECGLQGIKAEDAKEAE